MTEYELIITVVNRGFADEVMAAARKAGASGGTVVNAKGAGTPELRKFFGTVIQPERELVLILVRHEARRPIMEAIANETGLGSEARGLCFSLPVDSVKGISLPEPDDEKEA